MEQAEARVKWGVVTVAIGPATIADMESGGTVLNILAKGTPWSVELPAETAEALREKLGAGAGEAE